MDEIARLQRELAEVQQTSATLRLSESNIIEIVSKLIQAGQLELLYTQNGKEYVTPAQLLSEVEDELLAHRGRVNLADLQPILNVDLSHIERTAQILLAKDPTVRLLNGQLIADWCGARRAAREMRRDAAPSRKAAPVLNRCRSRRAPMRHISARYLDALAEQIDSAVQQAGQIRVADLAVEHGFSMDFLNSELLGKHLGGVIDAKLAQGTLYTPAYVTRHAAQMRGALLALVQPTSLAHLEETHKLNSSLVAGTLAELSGSAQVAGTVHAGAFIPALFEAMQHAAADAFYAANGYVAVAHAAKLQVQNPRKWLRARYPDALELESCVAASAVVERVEALLDECAASAGALELRDVMPPHLTDADCAVVLAKCGGAYAKGGVRLVGERWLVSRAMVEQGRALVIEGEEARARERAAAGGLLPTAAVFQSSLDSDDDDNEAVIITTALRKPPPAPAHEKGEAGGGAKPKAGRAAKGKRTKGKRGNDSDDSADDGDDGATAAGLDDLMMLPRAGGKGGKKGAIERAGGGAGGTGGAAAKKASKRADAHADGGGARAPADADAADERALARALADALSVDAELGEALAAELLPELLEARTRAAREVQSAGAGAVKKRQQELLERAQADTARLQLLARGVATLEADANVALDAGEVGALCRPILDCCAATTALLIESELLHQRSDHARAPLGADTDARRAALGKLRNGAHKGALTRAWAAATAKPPHAAAALETFLAALKEGCEVCSMLFAPLDKKTEKVGGARRGARCVASPVCAFDSRAVRSPRAVGHGVQEHRDEWRSGSAQPHRAHSALIPPPSPDPARRRCSPTRVPRCAPPSPRRPSPRSLRSRYVLQRFARPLSRAPRARRRCLRLRCYISERASMTLRAHARFRRSSCSRASSSGCSSWRPKFPRPHLRRRSVRRSPPPRSAACARSSSGLPRLQPKSLSR